MDPQPQPELPSKLARLDREENRLWRLVLLFISLLAVGLAAALWDTLTQLSLRFSAFPIAVVFAAMALAYYTGRRRHAITELRQSMHSEQSKPAAQSQDDVEQLVDIIRRSQRGFRELVDSFDDVVLAISLDGNIQAANRRFANILGLNFPDFVYRHITEFIQQPSKPEVARILPRIMDYHQWSGIVEVHFRKDATPRFFDCTARSIMKDGQVQGVSIWGREVTEQREREVRFTDLFETLQEGVYFSTPDGSLLDGNNALIQMLGFSSKSELQSVRITDLYVDPAERDRTLVEVNQRTAVQDREIRLRRRDGSEITCLDSSRAIYDNEGRVVRYQGTLVDITQRRQVEAALLEQQQFNKRLIECFPDAILVVGKDMKYRYASPRMQEILGWDPESMVGCEVASGEDRREPARLYHDVLQGKEKVGSIECLAQHRNGEFRTVRCTASPLVGPGNEIVGVVASLRDITTKKQMEQQLVQAERLAAMGQMIDGFAHELNNPLTAIMGAIDLLDTSEHEAARKHSKLLKQQARRAVEIVQNLLFFSRPPSRGSSRVNMNELIQRTLLLHQYSLRVSGITVDFLPEPSLPLYEGDANQLMQVFLNLLINAEQAIRTVRERGSIRVRLGRTADKVWISFQDDGPGIADEALRNIFDPFYSTKRPGGGVGMGLSVALGIVKGYGGDIDVSTAPGGGAVFTVALPHAVETASELAAAVSRN
jgi:PAS domain S-box-containing protein